MSSDAPLALYFDPVHGLDCNAGLTSDCAVRSATGLANAIKSMDDAPEIIMYHSPDLGRWVRL